MKGNSLANVPAIRRRCNQRERITLSATATTSPERTSCGAQSHEGMRRDTSSLLWRSCNRAVYLTLRRSLLRCKTFAISPSAAPASSSSSSTTHVTSAGTAQICLRACQPSSRRAMSTAEPTSLLVASVEVVRRLPLVIVKDVERIQARHSTRRLGRPWLKTT